MKVLLKIYDSGKSETIEEHEISWFEIKTTPIKEANSNEDGLRNHMKRVINL